MKDLVRERVNDHGAEAILFVGPTLPAMDGLPRRAAWPGDSQAGQG